ncbi:hypothetical protein [Frankia sp. Cr2]|uniref:hypothetical protein n=1 Tax=Frankia sp. Cr2 TaxID=3073932 RepID=UPI002AD24C31|nr:hypothetical protein [Frankia sp. Cr2]
MPVVRKELARLDEVDWSSLRTAHGTAEHVPAALRALREAEDTASVHDAYWKLDNYIVLQGTLYESAYFAAPYILDILLSAQWPSGRVAAYDLLIEIACGVADPGLPTTVVGPGGPMDLREACRTVIASGRSAYAADLRLADGALRRRALDLLTSIDDDPKGLDALLAGIDPGDDEEFARLLERARRELEF